MSILNQAVSSATNFLVGALLVRQLSREGFGVWTLGFSVMLLGLNAGEALFMTPMTTTIACVPQERGRAYAASVIVGSAVVSGAMTIPLAVVAAILFQTSGVEHVAIITSAVALASLLLIVKETLIRICYAMHRETTVFLANVAFGIVALGLILGPGVRVPSAVFAVASYGAAALIAAIVAIIALRLFKVGGVIRPLAEVKALCRDGRWYLGSHLAYWLRLQAPTLVATWTLGLASVGLLSAGRLLTSPPVMLNPALGQVAFPRLAAIAGRDGDPLHFVQAVVAFAGTLIAACAAYAAVLWVFYDEVVDLLLGAGQTVPPAIAAAWCSFALVAAARNAAEIALKARRDVRSVVRANVIAAVLAFPLCLIASAFGAEVGVVLGAAAAEAALVYLMVMSFKRRAAAERRPCEVPDGTA